MSDKNPDTISPAPTSGGSAMLRRFCLYGFLKNQQYYDLFLLLAMMQKGLSFAQFGWLIGIRELAIFLMEVPTGAVADVLGRRRAMAASMVAYMIAFAMLAMVSNFGLLVVAMICFAVGEAFRTGTHKAIIVDWLTRQGRSDEKTAVYGRTRSWSQLGSAASVVIAGTIVFHTGDYASVFWWCLIPYTLNLVNMLTYPRELDGARNTGAPLAAIVRTLRVAAAASWRRKQLRRALLESMSFEGFYRTTKDYLQPVLVAAAAGASLYLWGDSPDSPQETAKLAATVGLPLYLLSSVASRNAHRLTRLVGGEMLAAYWLWALMLLTATTMAFGALLDHSWMMIGAFMVFAIGQNLWLPISVSRVAEGAGKRQTATILSIKSQAKCLFVAVAAPLVGWGADRITEAARSSSAIQPSWRLLPIAGIGIALATLALATWRPANYDSLKR
jgi:MFS family permease